MRTFGLGLDRLEEALPTGRKYVRQVPRDLGQNDVPVRDATRCEEPGADVCIDDLVADTDAYPPVEHVKGLILPTMDVVRRRAALRTRDFEESEGARRWFGGFPHLLLAEQTVVSFPLSWSKVVGRT